MARSKRQTLTRPLRVALLWNGTLHREELYTEAQEVTLGTSGRASFAIPEGVLPEASDEGAKGFAVFEPDADGVRLCPHPGFGGFVFLSGARRAASELGAPVRLGDDDYGVLTIGAVALFFQVVRAARHSRPARRRWDGAVLACLGFSLFVHVGGLLFLSLVAAKEFAAPGELELDAELVKRFMVVPPPEDEPLLPRRKSGTETEDPGMRARDELGGKKHEREQGKVGHKDAKREDTKVAGDPKEAMAAKVKSLGLLGVLGGGGPSNAALSNALDTPSLDKMLGGLGSLNTVTGRGSGGMGLRGSGSGGGGTGKGSLFGAGELGTGIGSGSGSGKGRGAGGVGLPGPKAKEAQLSLDDGGAKVRGFLSKEQIDRVVRANQAAIKYCFEVEMQRQPNLQGAVHMSWRIDLTGQVTVVKVAKSTLGNARVEGCMSRQIKRWTFPKPDGGEVDVLYPFLLRGS